MGLWVNAGGPKSQAPTAAAIAEARSGGDPAAGLWGAGGGTDPAASAAAAVDTFSQRNSFAPFPEFRSGAFRGFVSTRTTPDLNVPALAKPPPRRVSRGGTPAPGGTGRSGTGGTGAAGTPAAGGNVGANPSECAWAIGWGGIPGTSWLADIFGSGGNLGSGQICLLSKSAFRGLIGASMIGGAGLFLMLPGVALLLAAATIRAAPILGTALEGTGAAVALIPGAEPIGLGIAGAGAATKHAGKGQAKKRSQSRAERRARADARLERNLGEPRENTDLRVGRGAIRETDAGTRARRAASPGVRPASAAEAGF
jgi:hypothetical protein